MSLLWKTAVHRVEAAGADSLWGKQDPDALFGGAPMRPPPFPSAPRRKDRYDYNKDKVTDALRKPPVLSEVDPRSLSRTQPFVMRGAVQHYLGDAYHHHGQTYADQDNAGNRFPVVYKRDDGTNLLLTGHHRATAAVLQGKPLRARVIEGEWPSKPRTS